MRIASPILLGMSLIFAGGTLAAAQDAAPAPPKVIQLTREWIKPGKSGMVHDRSEAAFVSLMNKAKLQGHYVALNSMSGKSRALYLTRYSSFEEWESDNKIINDKNAAEFDRAAASDGDLLEGMDQAVFTYVPTLSYHTHADISQARYYELTAFHVRPGHRKDWYELTKMWKDVLDKAGSGEHWAAYELAFGGEGGTYLVITARKSMSEIDQGMSEGAKVMEAAGGEDGFNKIDELFGQAVDSTHSELLSVNPKQSYPEEAWVKANPDFWKPKMKAPETATSKPAAPKPAPQAAGAAKPGTR